MRYILAVFLIMLGFLLLCTVVLSPIGIMLMGLGGEMIYKKIEDSVMPQPEKNELLDDDFTLTCKSEYLPIY